MISLSKLWSFGHGTSFLTPWLPFQHVIKDLPVHTQQCIRMSGLHTAGKGAVMC